MRQARPSTRKGDSSEKRPVNEVKRHDARYLRDTEISAYRMVCRAVNTPFALKCLSLIDSGDHLGLLQLPMPDPEGPSFADDYLVHQALRKSTRLRVKVDRQKAATDSFKAGELACEESNTLIRAVTKDFAKPAKASLALHPKVLAKVRGFIRDVLGPVQPWLEKLPNMTKFGPGAQFHCAGKDLTPFKKIGARMGITPSLLPFIGSLEPHGLIAASEGYGLTAGSRASFAPKDALTDRFIAIEPSLNMMWQLAVGRAIRSRLKVFGLDLRVQASQNRVLARIAQEFGLATIDLKNASNSIALLVVRYLLPDEWVNLLNLFRSPKMLVDNEWVTLEMFSSMGNGFTFELETLIFWAIARAYDQHAVTFGDDIIVDQTHAKDVIRALQVFGFAVNERKTYLAGTFFESCGEDYWHGRNVRPFYFRKEEDIHDTTTNVIRMANAVRLYAHRRNLSFGCDRRFLPVHRYLVKRCGAARNTAIPVGSGNDGIIRNWDEAAPSQNRLNGHEGWLATVFAAKPVRVRCDDATGLYASLMRSRPPGPDIHGITIRDFGTAHKVCAVKTLRVPSVDVAELRPDPNNWAMFEVRGQHHESKLQTRLVPHWPDLGPWV